MAQFYRGMKHWTAVALLVTLAWNFTGAYRPVIIFHGIFSDAKNMEDLVSLIQNAEPGTQVYNIDGFDNMDSLKPMWEQVETIRAKMLPIMSNLTDGGHLICFSQGGLICRAILETVPNHNIRTFVSLSSPQAGQYGDTIYLKYFPTWTKEFIYTFFYSEEGQKISIANYWKDPHHLDLYEKHNVFLPVLNTPTNSSYKSNFVKLEKLVLIGGPDDGVITPWQSSHFAFYDENEQVVEYQSQDYYTSDAFGLQTLDKAGKIHIHEVPGVEHVDWHGNKDVFTNCIEPYLD